MAGPIVAEKLHIGQGKFLGYYSFGLDYRSNTSLIKNVEKNCTYTLEKIVKTQC